MLIRAADFSRRKGKAGSQGADGWGSRVDRRREDRRRDATISSFIPAVGLREESGLALVMNGRSPRQRVNADDRRRGTTCAMSWPMGGAGASDPTNDDRAPVVTKMKSDS
jgi:hypothetical protein